MTLVWILEGIVDFSVQNESDFNEHLLLSLRLLQFGFHNASSIDSLLDKEDISLEAILDEDDLLQECKAQNARLIDYFQRVDVLQRLMAYVMGQIDGDEKGRFKYPYVATEVLCSEIWSIVETCVNSSEQILAPFWETVLDRSAEDMRMQMTMASHFAKINAVFLNKKPTEMLAFIKSQPNVVERLLRHVETPAFVDLLVRIMQLDEQPIGYGVLEWLSSQNFIGRLIDLLSSEHSSDMHTVVSELVKGVISMGAPSPGAGLTEGLQNGPASNRFAREIAHRGSVSKLIDYILADYNPSPDEENESLTASTTTISEKFPNAQSSASSVVQAISIIIELIRKNNTDYFEPYLFHTLRNRLIQAQQHTQANTDDGRDKLEQALKEMVDRMGMVTLGNVLELVCDRLETFQQYLRHPRSMEGAIATTVGSVKPLTFERYRICEFYAEMLHCSNMAIMNRGTEFDNLYDTEGRLQGGLHGLEELAKVIAIASGEDQNRDKMDEDNDEIEPAMELPVSNASRNSPSLIDSDEDMSSDDDDPGSSDDDAMEEIAMYDEPAPSSNLTSSPLPQPPILVPSSPDAAVLPSPSDIAVQSAAQDSNQSLPSSDSDSGLKRKTSTYSRRSAKRRTTADSIKEPRLCIGERLKQRFLDVNVLATLLDLFFEFPWNNFLHSVVYDLIHQILTGRVDGTLNRELTVALFRDANLMQRIVDGQKRNDAENSKPKGVRLGYMGHLTLISEDVISSLEHYPPDLRLTIAQYAPQPAWDEYVTGRYNETKKKDASLLGGGKPVVSANGARNTARWKVEEEESTAASPAAGPSRGGVVELKSEFKRTSTAKPARESSADFGPAPMDDEEEEEEGGSSGPPHFARYLAQEMQSSDNFGSSSSDASDDEEEDAGSGWLTHSTFHADGLGPSSSLSAAGERRPLSASGFDDVFEPGGSVVTMSDPFRMSSDENDAFGPFSDSAASNVTDPFTFSSSFTEDDAAFDSFGDFGDFQSAEDQDQDGELTPTAGSWTFTSGSNTSDEWSGSDHEKDKSELDPGEGLRTALDGTLF
ncbi:SAPS-domain-containing protein [Athelia psychrophila]|uniref:SAPS-domain-containing protein n=1 Tax=Athelia psychrophila TaxID=1759441 RepID=A0A165ZS58_9AGAM|nr:SAPS-domain-containing protein [Fibularhizoctonia sp. CBS 109695]